VVFLTGETKPLNEMERLPWELPPVPSVTSR
jgi:hypothetical protein